jgi:hypothetical protein
MIPIGVVPKYVRKSDQRAITPTKKSSQRNSIFLTHKSYGYSEKCMRASVSVTWEKRGRACENSHGTHCPNASTVFLSGQCVYIFFLNVTLYYIVKILSQIIFFCIHPSQSIFFSTFSINLFFLSKKTMPEGRGGAFLPVPKY